MTRVGNVEQVLLLLRERLQRRTGGERLARGAASGAAGTASPRPIERARALAALESLPEEEVRRVMIRGLLAEELGEAVTNDPGFQHIVDEVVRIIVDMPGGTELIGRATAQFRADD